MSHVGGRWPVDCKGVSPSLSGSMFVHHESCQFVRPGFSLLALALTAMLAGLPCLSASAATPAGGSSTRQAREDAIKLLPMAKLNRETRDKVEAVVNDTSLFRRLPTQVIECDPTMYLFLVEHPEVVVNLWEMLEISDVKLRRTNEDSFFADDGAGTQGIVDYLHRSHDLHLLYCDGIYQGPIFNRKVRGRCVILLKTGYVTEPSGKCFVTCRVDAFIHLDNVSLDLLVKTFQPVVGPVADHNFRETLAFVETLNRAVEINHTGVEQLVRKLKHVQPETRDRFAAIGEEMTARASLAKSQRPDTTLEATSPPPLRTSRRPNLPSKN